MHPFIATLIIVAAVVVGLVLVIAVAWFIGALAGQLVDAFSDGWEDTHGPGLLK